MSHRLTKEQFKNREKVAAALYSGLYVQTIGCFRDGGGHCFYGVAADVLDPKGWTEELPGVWRHRWCYPGSPTQELRELLGIEHDDAIAPKGCNIITDDDGEAVQVCGIGMNDEHGFTLKALRVSRYEEWLHTKCASYGFAHELAVYALVARGSITNDVPPVEFWINIIPTLNLVVKIRERFGITVINPAYRSPAYNAAVGGEDQSWHMKNFAIDFHCETGAPREWQQFLRGLREQGAFKGGIGLYKTFVHVDTRGVNADWVGAY